MPYCSPSAKPPENFAWASIERALEFAEVLSEVSTLRTEEPDENAPVYSGDSRYLAAILDKFIAFSSAEFVVLWKLKERARHASVIVRSSSFDSVADPNVENHSHLFVCPFDQPHMRRIIEDYTRKISNRDKNTKGIVFVSNILDSKVDHYIPKDIIVDIKLKKEINILFFSAVDDIKGRNASLPNYMISIYPCDYEINDEVYFIPNSVFNALKYKIKTGKDALMEKRLNGITRAMSNVRIADAQAGAEYAMTQALLEVIPRFICCERAFRLIPSFDGTFKVVMDKEFSFCREGCSNQDAVPLSQDSVQALADHIDYSFNKHAAYVSSVETHLITNEKLVTGLCGDECSNFRSLLVGKIHNRAEPNTPRGYLVLANRLNDGAISHAGCSNVSDFFDWEDQVYLSHVCSILDFIAELFTVEEARLRLTQILAHELNAPLNFVEGTTERLLEAANGEREIPDGMKKKELNDILDTIALQTTLIDSLMLRIESDSKTPSERYKPRPIDLSQVAEDVKRLLKPTFRKENISEGNIQINSLPKIYMDRKAAVQIFLNLFTNAIKYRVPKKNSDFKLIVYFEETSVSEMEYTTNLPDSYVKYARSNRIDKGILILFEDYGVGVCDEYANKIFRPGVRSSQIEVRSKMGAGLGLSVVSSILKDYFGAVWLQEKRGPTKFEIFLPQCVQTGEYQKHLEWLLGRS